jgi:hypothetical protein
MSSLALEPEANPLTLGHRFKDQTMGKLTLEKIAELSGVSLSTV